MGSKKCRRCEETKSFSEFSIRKDCKSGFNTQCKHCIREKSQIWREANPERRKESQRDSAFFRKFGLRAEGYIELLKIQGGVCAICKSPPNGRRLSVDHCHKTGKNRGLLCISCNAAIGGLKEDPRLFTSALEYLGFS